MNSLRVIVCCCVYFLLISCVTGADNDTTVADTVASTTPTATSSLGSGDSAGATLFPSFRQMILCVLTSIISPERTYSIPSGTFSLK